MKRRFGLVLFVSVVLCLTWLLVPAGHADSNEIITQAPAPNTAAVDGPVRINSAGLPNTLNERAPLSTTVMTSVGGPGTAQVSLLASLNGRENYVADRGAKLQDFAGLFIEPDGAMTRVGISEHSFANGFNENVFYYGDTQGNLFVGTDTNPGINPGPGDSVDVIRQINIPALVSTLASGGVTLLNPQAGDCTDDQVTVTGIAVNPVADLGDFGSCGTIGEVVYVSVLETSGCATNAANQPFRSRIFAFAFTDGVGAGAATPVGAIQMLRNPLSNAGIAVDDDGSLYFQLVDLLNTTGAAIFKVSEGARTVAGCATNPRINRVVASIPGGLNGAININSAQGTVASPVLLAGGMRLTNFSGPSTTFGNIAALSAAPGNTIYAALARSFVATDDVATQATEGLFTNPAALGATPSLVIAFTDASGANDACSSPGPGIGNGLPVADGFSDGPFGVTRTVGVNNFRVFALGNGPDIRPVPPATSPIVTSNTLKLDLQIDFSRYAGLTVDEEGTVFVISGAAPAGVGLNPSPTRGEILAFQDQAPFDRRADFIDFRGDNFTGNVGDGDSDRFDHVYFQSPLDVALPGSPPSALSGLSRGFLRFTNRLAPNAISPGVTLGQTVPTLGDDATAGPILFEGLDPSHQVAGGDDQNSPFRGDDSDGFSNPAVAGNPTLAGPLEGGFEFLFGVPGSNGNVWNALFINSNGNITLGVGDNDFTPTTTELYSGAPRIAPAWADLNPSARGTSLTSFPVQAIGFANVNAFKVRYINVPAFGSEQCVANSTNNFAVTLYDDGVGPDENSNQALNPANPIGNNGVPFDLQEGPTDLRFTRETTTNTLVGENPRPNGSGYFVFDYGRMDLIGAPSAAVISGYAVGGGAPTNPPGLCEVNLGEAARAAEANAFGVLQGQTASIRPNLIGEGTESAVFELFNEGTNASIGPEGEIFFVTPDYDLRIEGVNNHAATPLRQRDLNKERVGFVGIGLPPQPIIQSVVLGPFVVPPNQPATLINAIGPVDIFVTGSGFFPNEVTTVCAGTPEERLGKTVSTSMVLGIDNNGDSVSDVLIALTNVTPISNNLIRGTLQTISGLPGTAFPLNALGPGGQLTVTTGFSAGDNNVFGPFARSAVSSLNVGNRSPVVLTSSPVTGECSQPQTLAITGGAFINGNGSNNVTSVTAVSNGTVVTATSFTILNASNLSATFNFPPGSIGATFLIFANGPNGTSRNMLTLPAGAPPGSPTGNEAGNLVTFSCAEGFQFSVANTTVPEACATVPITVTRINAAATTTTVDFATADGTAQQRSDYSIRIGKLTFAPGETSKTINVLINEDSFVEPPETFSIILSNPSSGNLGTPSTSTITITDNDAVGSLVPAPKLFVASLRGSEEVPPTGSAGRGLAILLLNAAETSARVSLIFGGLSSAQTAAHIHGPAPVGANAAVLFPLPNGQFNEFNIALTPAQVADLKAGLHYVNVHTTNFPNGEIRGQLRFNPIDDPANFVCQQYHDFLDRDPDPGGLAYWTDQIASCGADALCVTRRRIAVAASFFFSTEFQETGFYIIRVYRTAFGGSAAQRPTFLEFFGDRSFFAGGGDLNAQKQAFADQFVTRSEFMTAYPSGLTPAQYVDQLNANTGNSLIMAERDALVAGLTNATQTRATVLKAIADNAAFRQSEFNPAFVAMQYLGELRRGADIGGFNFWLATLNANHNNNALVCAFITSSEYQSRFGPEITRNDWECTFAQ